MPECLTILIIFPIGVRVFDLPIYYLQFWHIFFILLRYLPPVSDVVILWLRKIYLASKWGQDAKTKNKPEWVLGAVGTDVVVTHKASN